MTMKIIEEEPISKDEPQIRGIQKMTESNGEGESVITPVVDNKIPPNIY